MFQIYDMAKYLLNLEKHPEKLLGHSLSLEAQRSGDLMTFWEKWRCVEPSNPIYVERANDLRYCVPCMLHGNEGVGHRRKPVMQLSWGSLLRVSYSSLERMFLITFRPHKMYSKLNKGASAGNYVLDKLLEECARSALRASMGIETNNFKKIKMVRMMGIVRVIWMMRWKVLVLRIPTLAPPKFDLYTEVHSGLLTCKRSVLLVSLDESSQGVHERQPEDA